MPIEFLLKVTCTVLALGLSRVVYPANRWAAGVFAVLLSGLFLALVGGFMTGSLVLAASSVALLWLSRAWAR